MKKIVLIRFSALGDLAMTVPVVASLSVAYPDLDIYILSRESSRQLFSNISENTHFIGINFSNTHRGFNGLFRIIWHLLKIKPDAIVDLHGVIRSIFITLILKLAGIRTSTIYKDRKSKKQLTRKNNKKRIALQNHVERYRSAIEKVGLKFDLLPDWKFNFSPLPPEWRPDKNYKHLGIAPFAGHPNKAYPVDKMEMVIQQLSQIEQLQIWLFGGGVNEIEILENWTLKYPNIHLVAGKLTLSDEIALMSRLDLMLTMDSANMHLSALANTEAITVWGATHPFAGFRAWKASDKNDIQIDLPCRPCSVYGNKPCHMGDFRCMQLISPEQIVDKVKIKLFSTK